MGERAADLAGADEGDLLAGHCVVLRPGAARKPDTPAKTVGFFGPNGPFAATLQQSAGMAQECADASRQLKPHRQCFQGLVWRNRAERPHAAQETRNDNLQNL